MQEPRAEGIGLGSDELFRERGGGGLEDSTQGLAPCPRAGVGRWVIPEMGVLGEKAVGVDGNLGQDAVTVRGPEGS